MAHNAAAAAVFVGDLTILRAFGNARPVRPTVAQTEDMVVVATDVDSADARSCRLDIQPSEAVHGPCRFRDAWMLRMAPGTCSSTNNNLPSLSGGKTLESRPLVLAP